MNMTKIKYILLISILSYATSSFAGGVPTMDIGTIKQLLENQTQDSTLHDNDNVDRSKQTTDVKNKLDENHNDLIDKQKEQHDEIYNDALGHGNQNIAQSVNSDVDYSKFLPDKWQDTLQKVVTDGKSGLDSDGNTIYTAMKIDDSCTKLTGDNNKKICEIKGAFSAQNIAFLKKISTTEDNINKQITKLQNKIGETKNLKQNAEIKARIEAENANLKNAAGQLDTYKQVSMQYQDMLNVKTKALMLDSISNSGTVSIF